MRNQGLIFSLPSTARSFRFGICNRRFLGYGAESWLSYVFFFCSEALEAWKETITSCFLQLKTLFREEVKNQTGMSIMKKIGVIFNQDAGSYKKLERDPEAWINEIAVRHAIQDVEFDVRAVPAAEIDGTIGGFIKNNYDVIAAAGGDGTINGVAMMIKDTDAVLGVIPSGTFNHFAKDAGIPLEFEAAVLNLVNGSATLIDYGSVNDRIFLNNSSIGQYPVAALTRETGRRRNPMNKRLAMIGAIVKTALRYPVLEISVESAPDAECLQTPLVFIGNNYYDISPLKIGKRNQLDSGKLYAYGSTCTHLGCSLHLAILALFNKLSLSKKFERVAFEAAVIRSKKTLLPVAVDGEIHKLKTPLHYQMHPKALKVILP